MTTHAAATGAGHGANYAARQTFRFSGENKRGIFESGSVETIDPARFVERMFKQGWRNLTVSEWESRLVVGAIDQPGGFGTRRRWWAESPTQPPPSAREGER